METRHTSKECPEFLKRKYLCPLQCIQILSPSTCFDYHSAKAIGFPSPKVQGARKNLIFHQNLIEMNHKQNQDDEIFIFHPCKAISTL